MKAKSERRRLFVGDQLKECRDASGLYYILGYQKGYLVNWDVQVCDKRSYNLSYIL